MGKKELICLANSRKLNGRCIAGKEPKKLWWVRPVSDTDGGEISLRDIRLNPRPLDIVQYPFIRYRTTDYHPENMVIGTTAWVKVGEYPFEDLEKICDHPETLWTNEDPDHRRISLEYIEKRKLPTSLYLIKPELFEVLFAGEYRADGNPKLLAIFKYNGQGYMLPITDIEYESRFTGAKSNSAFKFDARDIYLCVSLSEPHNGFCYKLVASVIQKPQATAKVLTGKADGTSQQQLTEAEKEIIVTLEDSVKLHPDTIWALWFIAKDSLEHDEFNQFYDIYQLLKNMKTPGGNKALEIILNSLTKRYEMYLKKVDTQKALAPRPEIVDPITLGIIHIIKSTKFGIGRSFICDVLKGAKTKRMADAGVKHYSQYAMLSHFARKHIMDMIDQRIKEGYFVVRNSPVRMNRPILILTEKAEGLLAVGSYTEQGAATVAVEPANESSQEYRKALFEALRRWRLKRANADGIPPYVVAHDRSLMGIIERAVKSLDDLSEVHGFGTLRIKKYGKEILKVIADFESEWQEQ